MRWPVSAKAVVVRDGAVLLARNDRDEWELPGGRVEAGEEPADAAVREVAEETGLVVRAGALLGLTPLEVLPDRVVLIAAYACVLVEDRGLVLSEEHEALQWHPLARLDELALPQVYRDCIAAGARGRVVLIGDSHLAKLDRGRLQQLSDLVDGRPRVVNHAAGGSTALDLVAEVDPSALLPRDRIVLSVGTNDFAQWKRVPLDRFEAAVDELLDRFQHHRVVVVLPPAVDERMQLAAGREHLRTGEDRAPYARVLQRAAAAHGAPVVDVQRADLHAPDGVHLGDAGNDELVARLAAALNALD